MKYTTDSGSGFRIDLDKDYYAGDLVIIEFALVQDYMYQMEYPEKGQTQYTFTPGWFDEIYVDELIITWNEDKSLYAKSGYTEMDGRYVWHTFLGKGSKYTVSVVYPSDAYEFSANKKYIDEQKGSGATDDTGSAILGTIFIFFMYYFEQFSNQF